MSSGAYMEFRMVGAKELDFALQQLQDLAVQRRVLIAAMKKALEPVAESARQRVPVDEGDLRDSIIVSTRITKNQARAARVKKGIPRVYVGSSWPTAHLIEFGTASRTVVATKKKVLASGGKIFGKTADVGSMPARPFIRPAFDANRERILDIFGKEMWKKLEATARRLFRQAESGRLSKSGARALGSS